jgi:hypothetical protein
MKLVACVLSCSSVLDRLVWGAGAGRYLDAAKECGEVIWREGLVKRVRPNTTAHKGKGSL